MMGTPHWMRVAGSVAWFALTLAGCGGSDSGGGGLDGFTLDSDGDPKDVPDTQVTGSAKLVAVPNSLEFNEGAIPVEVSVRNDGKSDVRVSDVALSASSASELGLDSVGLPSVKPGEAKVVGRVTFAPGAGKAWEPALIGTLVITHDNSTQGPLQIPIYITSWTAAQDAATDSGDDADADPMGPLFDIDIQPTALIFGEWRPAGATLDRVLKIHSAGDGPAVLLDGELVYDAMQGDPENTFEIIELRGCAESVCNPIAGAVLDGALTLPGAGLRLGTGEVRTSLELVVRYTQPAIEVERVASLTLYPGGSYAPTELSLTAPVISAAALVSPTQLNLGTVAANQPASGIISVESQSSAPLKVSRLRLTGAAGFSAKWGSSELATGDDLVIDPPLTLLSGQVGTIQVGYVSPSFDAAEATLTVFTNDPDFAEGGHDVVLRANQNAPCLAITPATVKFGTVASGLNVPFNVELKHCGGDPLLITEIALVEGSDSDFSLDFGLLPGGVTAPSPAAPLIVSPGGTAVVRVRFHPTAPTPPGPNGPPVPQTATLRVLANTAAVSYLTPISAVATETYCPTAAFAEVTPTASVEPGHNEQLNGTLSVSPTSAITEYQWTAEVPEHAVARFVPSPASPIPFLEFHSLGTWNLGLHVKDAENVWSCIEATDSIEVQAPAGLHVELFWDTPGDPDKLDVGDDAGTNLDLHVCHPLADGPDIDGDGSPDPWFDNDWTAYWFGPYTTWGAELGRADGDGWGPEFVTVEPSSEELTYRVGVYYESAGSYGPSTPTLKFWLDGELALTLQGPALNQGDLWDAAQVTPASGLVEPVLLDGDVPKVTPNYPGLEL